MYNAVGDPVFEAVMAQRIPLDPLCISLTVAQTRREAIVIALGSLTI